jgi:hypothetical protein
MKAGGIQVTNEKKMMIKEASRKPSWKIVVPKAPVASLGDR